MFRSHRDLVRTPPNSKTDNQTTTTAICYKCDLCENGSNKWLTETDILFHKLSIHAKVIQELATNSQERFCTVCLTLFKNYSELLSHIKTYHLLSSEDAVRVEREIFICNYCQHIFFNKELLAVHILYLHNTNGNKSNTYYPCPKCRRNIKLRATWHHFQCHDITSVTLCNICLTNQSCKSSLIKHMDTHKKHYKCEECNYGTMKASQYYEHLKKHNARPVIERDLSKVMKRAYIKHKKDVFKTMQNSFRGLSVPSWLNICVICREICTDNIEVKNHLLRDHYVTSSTVGTKHACHCGKTFFNKVLLKQHMLKMGDDHDANDTEEATYMMEMENIVSNKSQLQVIPDLTSVIEYVDVVDETTEQCSKPSWCGYEKDTCEKDDALISVLVYPDDCSQGDSTEYEKDSEEIVGV